MHVHTAHTGMPQLHGITYSQYHTLHYIKIYLQLSYITLPYNYKCTALSSHVVVDSPAQATLVINMIQ